MTKIRMMKPSPLSCFYKYILPVLILICLDYAPAFPVDFITEEEFLAEKNAYKDYPLKILFKKLTESDPHEKREIRNLIILKQVFDPDVREKAGDGVLDYQESFGVIKGVSAHTLKLWIPSTDSSRDFYIGIDRIPLENRNRYKVTSSNISGYGAVVYSLDGRIYKIRIDLQLSTPTGLYLKREGNQNIVGWNETQEAKKPVGYKVFVNGEPFKTVEGTVVEVPRIEGRVDRYHVKAIYKHGNNLIDSEASDVLKDKITAKEIQQGQLARERYDGVVAALSLSEWEKAKRLLYDNRQLFEDYLDEEQKGNAVKLTGFFRDIDEGDRIRRGHPDSLSDLEMALRLYRRAEQKSKGLPQGADLLFLVEQKINEGRRHRAQLESRKRESLAGEIYGQIITALKLAEWEKARKLLSDNQQPLTEHLDEERKENAVKLIGFFRDIEEGDRIRRDHPDSLSNLEMALKFYNRAEQKAEALSTEVDLLSITQMKVTEGMEQKALIEARNIESMAEERYEQIITALNLAEWEKARKILYDNSKLLKDHLDKEKKEIASLLVGIFSDIDKGDSLSVQKPETARNLGMALRHYNRADQKAKGLSPGIDITSMTELKISVSTDRKAALETRDNALLAGETYDEVLAALKPLEWEKGRKLLYDNQKFMLEYLDKERKENTEKLISFFRDIDEGDRLRRERPDSLSDIERALRFYKAAEQKSKGLPANADVLFIAERKIDQSLNLKTILEAKNKEALAGERYEQILSALNPAEWEKGQKLLYDNQQFLREHLDQKRKGNVETLVRFFRDIDEGDRISNVQPETLKSVETAIKFYREAEERVKPLKASIDLIFITEKKVNEGMKRMSLLEAKEQALRAPKVAKVEPTRPPARRSSDAVRIEIPEESDKKYDRNTQILYGLREFDRKDYTASLNHFMKVFRRQINNIKQGGKKQVYGVLALPVECRAEIIFLVELDRLINESNITDKAEVISRLEEISESIENREGLWVIIRDASKRRKIRRHIASFK